MKFTINYELPHKTVEEFDKWRDEADDKCDACDVCPVKQLCDFTMIYDSAVDEQEQGGTAQLDCSGIYKMALGLNNK